MILLQSRNEADPTIEILIKNEILYNSNLSLIIKIPLSSGNRNEIWFQINFQDYLLLKTLFIRCLSPNSFK